MALDIEREPAEMTFDTNDDENSDEVFRIEEASRGWGLGNLPWWLIGPVAIAIGELTTHRSFGIVTFCLKFGWNDLRTGWWLRHRDPDHLRGIACGWFFWSIGLWRVVAWSFGLMLGFVILLGILDEFNDENLIEVSTCGIVSVSSGVLAMIVTIVAMGVTWRSQRKVWVHPSIHVCRARNEWPPKPVGLGSNQMNYCVASLLGVALLLGFVAFLLVVITAIDNADAPRRRNPNGDGAYDYLGGLIGAGLPIGMAIFLLFFSDYFQHRLGTKTPSECWENDQPTPSV